MGCDLPTLGVMVAHTVDTMAALLMLTYPPRLLVVRNEGVNLCWLSEQCLTQVSPVNVLASSTCWSWASAFGHWL